MEENKLEVEDEEEEERMDVACDALKVPAGGGSGGGTPVGRGGGMLVTDLSLIMPLVPLKFEEEDEDEKEDGFRAGVTPITVVKELISKRVRF